MEMNDNFIYGECEIPDCPSISNGDYCLSYNKRGIHPPAAARKGKIPHITAPSSLPMYKIKGGSAWGGRTTLARNTFVGFKPTTVMGKRQSVFGTSKYQPDYTPMLSFTDSTFIDIE